ncbi:MAG: hypothetical protein GY696_40690 [Gammaproteobacteria bacterium]|nr:hypothetical protein [Gammaproteobacteria bacterium]
MQRKSNWQPWTPRVLQLPAFRMIQGGIDQGQPAAYGANKAYDDKVAVFESVHALAGFG